MMQGGAFLTSGADTCVYAPEVACAKQPKPPLPAGSYVSRITEKKGEAKDKRNQALVKDAIQRIKEKYSMDVSGSFNLAAAVCTPKFKEADLVGGPCEADENNTTAPGKQKDKLNFVTPKQDEDFKDSTEARNPVMVEKLRKLFRDVVFLNNEGIVHGDIHDGNVSWMGDHLVLHDWGRTYHGVKGMRKALKERYFDKTHLQELFGKCTIVLEGKPDDDTLRRYMMFFDIVNMTYELLKNSTPKIQHADLDTFISYLNTVWDSKVSGDELRVKILRGVHTLFPQGQAAPPAPAPAPAAPPPPKDDLHEGGGQTERFCSCVKKVKKTLKARPGSTKESGAIAICTKSVLQTKGRTIRKVRCRDKVLETQPMKGGVYLANGVHTYVFAPKNPTDKQFLPLATCREEKEFRIRYHPLHKIWEKNPIARVVIDGDGEVPVHRAVKDIARQNPCIRMGTNTFIDTYFIDERLLSKSGKDTWKPMSAHPSSAVSRKAAEQAGADALTTYVNAREPEEGEYKESEPTIKDLARAELLSHVTYDHFEGKPAEDAAFVDWIAEEKGTHAGDVDVLRDLVKKLEVNAKERREEADDAAAKAAAAAEAVRGLSPADKAARAAAEQAREAASAASAAEAQAQAKQQGLEAAKKALAEAEHPSTALKKRFRCIVSRKQGDDIGKSTKPPIQGLLDIITTLLHIDGRFVHGDLHASNVAYMPDGTPVIHDFGETTFRDYLDKDAGPVTNPKSESMLWTLISRVRESPRYYYTYTQYRYQSLLLEPDVVNPVLLEGALKAKSDAREAAANARADAAKAAEKYIDAAAAAAADAAKQAKADAAAASAGRLAEAQAQAKAASERAAAAADAAQRSIATPPSAILNYKNAIQKAYREFSGKYDIYAKATAMVTGDLRNLTVTDIKNRREATVFVKTPDAAPYRNILELKKLGFLYDEGGNVVEPETVLGPGIKFYLDPIKESKYHQLARIWDILSILAYLEKVDPPLVAAAAPVAPVAPARPPPVAAPDMADEAPAEPPPVAAPDMADEAPAEPPPLAAAAMAVEAPAPVKTVKLLALGAINKLIGHWGKGEASKENVRMTVNELRTALGLPETTEEGEMAAADVYWKSATPARAPAPAADMAVDAAAAVVAPAVDMAVEAEEVGAMGIPRPTDSVSDASALSHILRHSISVLEDIRGEGILPSADDEEEDDVALVSDPAALSADPIKQHALIKDLAPMVIGSYYRDHKGNPYSVIDEYIITDEDLPVFRTVMKQLIGGVPDQVAFIRLRFYLLYADMLQVRYEHLLDELGGPRFSWKEEHVGLKPKFGEVASKVYAYVPPTQPINGVFPDMDGYIWVQDNRDRWVLIKSDTPDLDFKIKVLESDSYSLHDKLKNDILRLDKWVEDKTIPDPLSELRPGGIIFDRLKPHQVLGMCKLNIQRARKLIFTRYKRDPPTPSPKDTAIEALITNKESPEAVETAKAEAAADAEAAAEQQIIPAPLPVKGGRRTSYRRGLSKLI